MTGPHLAERTQIWRNEANGQKLNHFSDRQNSGSHACGATMRAARSVGHRLSQLAGRRALLSSLVKQPLANAMPPGDLDFRAPGAPSSPFSFPRRRGKWSAGRRRGLARPPDRTLRSVRPRAWRGRAPPVRRGAAPPGAPSTTLEPGQRFLPSRSVASDLPRSRQQRSAAKSAMAEDIILHDICQADGQTPIKKSASGSALMIARITCR